MIKIDQRVQHTGRILKEDVNHIVDLALVVAQELDDHLTVGLREHALDLAHRGLSVGQGEGCVSIHVSMSARSRVYANHDFAGQATCARDLG